MAITVTGTEQESYFHVVVKAAELLMPDVKDSIRLVTNGMLKLTEGKMSSRTGDVIPAMQFIANVVERVKERMREDTDESTAQKIAIGAIKYAVLKNSTGKDILFDPKKSIALEGDTGPYLQYTYARARSILRKAEEQNATWKPGFQVENFARGTLAITEVERLLYRFPEVVERAVKEYEPHHVGGFLNDLASAFNTWYAQEQVLDGGEAQNYKLALTQAVATTLKNGLWVLGINTPEKM